MRVFLDDFVSPAVEKIESLDNLIGRLITAVDTTVRMMELFHSGWPLVLRLSAEFKMARTSCISSISMSSFPATFLMSCAI